MIHAPKVLALSSLTSIAIPAFAYAETSTAVEIQTTTADMAGIIGESSDPFYLERLQQILGLGGNDPRLITARLIEVFLSFVGVILLLMILKGGLLWMVSGANDERRAEARKTLGSAIIGTFIILASYSIVRFIFSALSAGTAAPAS